MTASDSATADSPISALLRRAAIALGVAAVFVLLGLLFSGDRAAAAETDDAATPVADLLDVVDLAPVVDAVPVVDLSPVTTVVDTALHTVDAVVAPVDRLTAPVLAPVLTPVVEVLDESLETAPSAAPAVPTVVEIVAVPTAAPVVAPSDPAPVDLATSVVDVRDGGAPTPAPHGDATASASAASGAVVLGVVPDSSALHRTIGSPDARASLAPPASPTFGTDSSPD